MKLSSACIRCMLDRQEERIREIKNENKKAAYLKEVAGIIAFAEANASAPLLLERINRVYKRYFGECNTYAKENDEFNSLMLSMEEELKTKIHAGTDNGGILKKAFNYARAANYIDFGAMNMVSKEQLFELLNKAEIEVLDDKTFHMFLEDMEKAEQLVFLTDNCGEIVADKLLIKVLSEQYPKLSISAIVRGKPVINDATIADAEAVGLTKIVRVISNGTGISGTQIDMLSTEARNVLGKADVIISKGQGNFETLYGCGLNIYYLFLCKCEWFSQRFALGKYKGVFINEKDLNLQH